MMSSSDLTKLSSQRSPGVFPHHKISSSILVSGIYPAAEIGCSVCRFYYENEETAGDLSDPIIRRKYGGGPPKTPWELSVAAMSGARTDAQEYGRQSGPKTEGFFLFQKAAASSDKARLNL